MPSDVIVLLIVLGAAAVLLIGRIIVRVRSRRKQP